MININGKEYKINTDTKWGTKKLMKKVNDDPRNLDNIRYVELIIKDVLIPSPTSKEMFNFKDSDIERIFEAFAEDSTRLS